MKSIRTKLILSILVITLFPVWPLYFLVGNLIDKSIKVGFNQDVQTALQNATMVSQLLFKQYKEETLALANELAASPSFISSEFDNHTFFQNTSLPDDTDIHIYKTDGTLIASYSNSTDVTRLEFSPEKIAELATSQQAHLLEFSNTPTTLSAFAPIMNGQTQTHFLILSGSIDQKFLQASEQIVWVNQMFKTLDLAREDLHTGFIKVFFVVYVPIALLSLGIGFLFSRKITSPLVKLVEGTEKVAAGDWQHRMQVSSRDEVGKLFEAFNTMLQRLKEQQDQVIELEKMAVWREMARVLAHEIKNPLTPIQLTVQQMRDKYAGDDPEYRKLVDECSAIVIDEINSLEKLVREFSDFARTPKLNLSEANLNELIEETSLLYSDYEVTLNLDQALTDFEFDVEQLRRILINFFENSTYSIKEKGTGNITIETFAKADRTLLKFSDSGQGIPANIKNEIFKPYFSTKKSGMGLGLAIVKRIIEEHGGCIKLTSVENEGALFEIELVM